MTWSRKSKITRMARPGFDSLTLAAFTHQAQSLVGGRIQGIRQPSEHVVVFEAYRAGFGGVRWLFDCSAQWARTHFTTERAPNPQSPPAFCAALRKFVEGGQILSIEQRGFDRILDIAIRGHEGADYIFTGEFMGRHSNLILLGPDEGGARKILHAAKLIPAKLSRVREILPNKIYVAPPAPDKLNPLLSHDAPLNAYLGISPFLAQEIAARTITSGSESAAMAALFEAAQRNQWQPVLLHDADGNAAGAYPLRLGAWPQEQQQARDSISAALDEYYAFAMPRAQTDGEKRTLSGVLNKAWEQRAQSLAQVEKGQKEGSRGAQFRRWGDLLLGNLWQIESGQSSAVVPDYFQDPPVEITIPLDADLSPQENAQAFFERARRGEKGAARLLELHAKMQSEIAVIEAAQTQLQSAESPEELAIVRELAQSHGWLHAAPSGAKDVQSRPDFGGKRIRAFTSPEGWQIFVGDNAEANDYLVQKLGQANDWWLHLRAGTSAHAIIRTNNAPQKVPRETLEFAARLVVARSAAKHAGVVAVDYTLKKYVRKPRKAPPGSVTYSQEKTLHVMAKPEA